MSFNYVVTAHKPTAVTHSLAGHFTGPDVLNVLLARGSRLEIYSVSAEGLKPVLDVPLYGHINYMQLFRTEREDKEWLFLLTSRYHVAVLAYDPASEDVLTKAYGDVKERVGRPCEGPPMCDVDPDCGVAVLNLYMGVMKVVPLSFGEGGGELAAFNVKLQDLYIIGLCFLTGYDEPTLAYLAETGNGRTLKTFTLNLKDQDLTPGVWSVDNVDQDTYFMLPLPSTVGGVLCVADYSLVWFNRSRTKAIDPPLLDGALISCYGKVDAHRYLLGDTNGILYMVHLTTEEHMDGDTVVTEMKMERLGEVPSARSVTYLDNGVVFVGSAWGDSQLVKLCSEPVEGSFVQPLDAFSNLGSIVDMVAVDLDKQGHDSIVTCSGYGKDSSLRIVQSGIGINELASIDLEGIKGVWSLTTGGSGSHDNTIVISFVAQTRVLSLTGEEVEETETAGFLDSEQTLQCGNVDHKQAIQVTPSSVRLVEQSSLNLVNEWKPVSGKKIGTSAFNSSQIVVAVGSDVHYLEIKDGELKETSHVTMDHEVACMDISLQGNQEGAELCAIGLWTDISVRLLKLPTLEQVHSEPLGGEIIPRSIAMLTMEEITYLLVALGDGCLIYYQMDPSTGTLTNKKRIVLGTKPVALKLFVSSTSDVNVFACSDRPTIVYSSNKKLLFSSVNLKEVNYMCTLNAEAYANSLVLATEESLVIGTVDAIQKLHIRSVPLQETPRRIAYQPSTQTLAVITLRPAQQPASQLSASLRGPHTISPSKGDHSTPSGAGEPPMISSVVIFDQNTFEVLYSLQLLPFEEGCSIISSPLGPAPSKECFVVGTAFAYPEEKEPKQGRILVLQWEGGKLSQLAYTLVGGPVYSLTMVTAENRVAAAAFSTVYVYNWKETKQELEEDCFYEGCILALYMKAKGDFVLMGDLMRSFTLLAYKEKELAQIAIDTTMTPSYMTAVDMLDDETFLGADSQHLFICQKNNDAMCEADLPYMVQPSRFCIGDSVNVFRSGSLVMNHGGGSLLQGKPILYGTVAGSIGIVGRLTEESFFKLKAIEMSLRKVVKSVGNIDYEVWRSFANEHRSKPAAGFIDGDLLEQFLDLPRDKMEAVAAGVELTEGRDEAEPKHMSVDEVSKLIEELARIH